MKLTEAEVMVVVMCCRHGRSGLGGEERGECGGEGGGKGGGKGGMKAREDALYRTFTSN